jgi:F0F1-type ATP synthase membrane subunit b/b'
MVTLNLTLLIELGLFLVFLWGTARFVLRPVLLTIDTREEEIEADLRKAQSDEADAARLELEYADALAQARMMADDTYRRARLQTLRDHQVFISEERERADATVAAVRIEALRAADEAKPAVLAAAPELANQLTEKLRRGHT